MKLSLILMLALTFMVLQCFFAGSDGASTRVANRAQYRALAARRRSSASYALRSRSRSPARRRGRAQVSRSRSYRRRNQPRRRNYNRKGRRVTPNYANAQRSRRRNYKGYSNRRRSYAYRRRGRQEDVASEDEQNSLETPVAEEEPPMLNDLPVEEEPIEDEDEMTVEELEEMMAEGGPDSEIEAEAAIEAAQNDPEKRQIVDANGDGRPDWCNWRTNMGAWLNFRNMRKWCANNGWNGFGPYGSVPDETNADDNEIASEEGDAETRKAPTADAIEDTVNEA